MDNEDKTGNKAALFKADTEATSPVTEITTEMMGILGQIKHFVASLDDSEDSDNPNLRRLKAALRFMMSAKNQLLAAEESAGHSDHEAGDTAALGPEVAASMDLLQSHIDENIRLRKVKEEVSDVMEILSSHLAKFGLKVNVQSADESSEESTESSEDTSETSVADEDEVSECGCAKCTKEKALEAKKLKEKERADAARRSRAPKAAATADETWTDDTDAGTTDDDQSSLASEASHMSDFSIRRPTVVILKNHLKKSNLTATFKPSEAEESVPNTGFTFACSVLNLEVNGHGRSKRSARLVAGMEMLRLLISHQLHKTLPSGITPFTDKELEELLVLCMNGNENPVNRLRTECARKETKPPKYHVTDTSKGPEGERQVIVQCDALDLSVQAAGTNKRKARRQAAKNLLEQFDKLEAA